MRYIVILLIIAFIMGGCVKEAIPLDAYDTWYCDRGSDMDGDGDIDRDDYYLYIKGEKGDPGKDGLNAYELWLVDVSNGLIDPKTGEEWPKDQIEKLDYYHYLTGFDGKDGSTPIIEIVDGYWYINGANTDVYAIGPKGDDGEQGDNGSVVTIVDGYWYIDGQYTGVLAYGDDGEDGKSAYFRWKEMISGGTVDDPRYDGDEKWPANENSEDAFYKYLRGRDGENGKDLDKPDAAYIDVTKQNIDIFYKGSGGAFTVKCNYKWTVKVLSEHSSVKADTYLKITPTYGQTYTMPDGSTYTTTDGSIAWQSLAIPDRDLTFEIRFETHNGNWIWVHESVFITIHAEGTKI